MVYIKQKMKIQKHVHHLLFLKIILMSIIYYFRPQFCLPSLDNKPSVVIKCFPKPYKLTSQYDDKAQSICNINHSKYIYIIL